MKLYYTTLYYTKTLLYETLLHYTTRKLDYMKNLLGNGIREAI